MSPATSASTLVANPGALTASRVGSREFSRGDRGAQVQDLAEGARCPSWGIRGESAVFSFSVMPG